MAEEAYYNYEMNYPENFTTIMATFIRRFFVIFLNIVFTMMLTSYIIDGTPPQETIHRIWTILFNFPVYMENTRRRREQEQEAEPDFNPADSDEELKML